jgi:tRNA-2-methylthio-N6-dimethylallyladenosine synthase
MKKVFIKTYGCQMNERDSEAVGALLQQRGYALTGSEADADVVLLNTCSVRDAADQKALGKMGMMAQLKRERPGMVLGFLGCMAQVRGASLLKEVPALDLVVGTQRFHHLPDYLDQLFARRESDCRASAPLAMAATSAGGAPALQQPIVDVTAEAGSESAVKDHIIFKGERASRRAADNAAQQELRPPVTGLVSIMQGCDMHCTFCIVPATRGAERSRPIPEIVEEVRQLVATGVKEVTLLGQIVTSYGHTTGGKSAFVKLLAAVHDVPGLERLRFTSPHPKGFGDDLVRAYRDLPKLCEYAHLPMQSGSDRILKLMKRGYSQDQYLRIIEKLRAARPGIAFCTDIIVGFPGETDEDFEATASLMWAADFDQAYIFKYSKRRDTPAAAMPEQVSREVKEQRHRAALAIINENLSRIHRQLVGQTVEVLVEGWSTKNPARLFGRTRTNHGVVLDGKAEWRGRLLPVRITRATLTTLYGEAI